MLYSYMPKELLECAVLAASMDNFSFHVWEILWDSCQVRVAIQAQLPTNTYV